MLSPSISWSGLPDRSWDYADRGLVYLNLLLLLTVVFIPYPTGIFGEALKRGQGQETAAVVYSVTMAANAFSWGALWLYASGRRLRSPISSEHIPHEPTSVDLPNEAVTDEKRFVQTARKHGTGTTPLKSEPIVLADSETDAGFDWH